MIISAFANVTAWLSSAIHDHKIMIEHSVAFHNDALHVIAGVTIQLTAAVIFRRSLADWLPWIAVVLLELGNELNDLAIENSVPPAMLAGEGIKDLILTIAIPTILLGFARLWPSKMVSSPTTGPDKKARV